MKIYSLFHIKNKYLFRYSIIFILSCSNTLFPQFDLPILPDSQASNEEIVHIHRYLLETQNQIFTSLLSYNSGAYNDANIFQPSSFSTPAPLAPQSNITNPYTHHTGLSLMGTFLGRELDYFDPKESKYSSHKVVGVHIEDENPVIRLENAVDIRLKTFNDEHTGSHQSQTDKELSLNIQNSSNQANNALLNPLFSSSTHQASPFEDSQVLSITEDPFHIQMIGKEVSYLNEETEKASTGVIMGLGLDKSAIYYILEQGMAIRFEKI